MSSEASGGQIAEQFVALDQQNEANLLGIWLFLATEAMLFGGLFLGYLVYHVRFPEDFAEASKDLHWVLGGINTALLLTSGLTMALAEHAVNNLRRRAALGLMFTTMALGIAFVAVKGLEYAEEFEDRVVPFLGLPFHYDKPHPGHAKLVYDYYFALTGLHAFHLTVALGLMAVMITLTLRWRDPERLKRQVQIMGMYWGFVDLVWVVVYSVLYLVNR